MANDEGCHAMSGDNLLEWKSIQAESAELTCSGMLTAPVKVAAGAIDVSESAIAKFLAHRLMYENVLQLGGIPVRMARYGMMEPSAFVAEMTERMEDAAAEGYPYLVTPSALVAAPVMAVAP